jgi:signal transduction histidine kinase
MYSHVRFRSIFARVILLQAIVIAVVSAVMPFALFWLMQSAANDLHGLAMLDQAESLSNHLESRIDGSLAMVLPPAMNDLYSGAYGRYAYAIIDETGRVLFSSLEEGTPVFPGSPRSVETELLTARQGSKTISGVEYPREIADRRIWVQVGEDLAHQDVLIDDIVTQFFRRVGWIIFPILALLLAADIVMFRRILLPLRQASQQARSIRPSRTDVRLPVNAMPSEISDLVQAVNQALDRLEQGFRAQREFAADAAHELRTPLTVLRLRVDTLAAHPTTKALRQGIDEMGRVVGQLLDLAESDTYVVGPSDRAELRSVCAEVVKLVAPLVIAQRKEICLDAADKAVWVKGNPNMMFRAVRNLVENAIRHAPQGTMVEVVVRPDGSISVLDQGPGINANDRELLFRRFWRRDSSQAGGAGLGLSIVRRLADAHMATVNVENRPSGGAGFSLNFFGRGA